MKETGMLFQGDMVRAILDLIKTHTRRMNGLKKINEDPDMWEFSGLIDKGRYIFKHKKSVDILKIKCPWGKAGDRVYVRETWTDYLGDIPLGYFLYRADFPLCWDKEDTEHGGDVEIQAKEVKWKPSIFMPRHASRIDLEITGISLERMQDISEEDAKAEGVERYFDEGVWYYGPLDKGHIDAKFAFRKLWDSINAERGYGWDKNPWVWVVEFRKI